jgi:hypothetical protein
MSIKNVFDGLEKNGLKDIVMDGKKINVCSELGRICGEVTL